MSGGGAESGGKGVGSVLGEGVLGPGGATEKGSDGVIGIGGDVGI